MQAFLGFATHATYNCAMMNSSTNGVGRYQPINADVNMLCSPHLWLNYTTF